MATTAVSVTDTCRAAKAAARGLAALPTTVKDAALLAIADGLEERAPEILEANARDMEAGRERGLGRRAARPPRADRRADRGHRRAGA
jgi:glutamate-5-semialdehyde dehydrogenase